MKKVLRAFGFLVVFAMIVGCFTGCKARQKLYVFNAGDYIGKSVVKEFEKAYPEYKVVYTTFDSNESMYTKFTSDKTPYDVIIPSDYMIERLISEGRLNKIDMGRLENYSKIGDSFKGLSYDPENEYSVPYMWGTLGIIYNKTKVDEPVEHWSIMWDEKYKNEVLMMNSMRDSMGISLKTLGYDINTTSPDEINAAKDKLIEQKKNVRPIGGTDNLKDKMVSGSAALSYAYSGDAVWMIDSNPDLDYAVPLEGSNVWYDAMVIPTTSKNIDGAYKFIDFMCSTKIVLENVDEIGYSTPQMEAFEQLDDSLKYNPVYSPSQDVIDRCVIYKNLDKDTLKLYSDDYEEVNISG
ncbi:MAG: ABC transporter substrate-binding protein [Clostridiales bacterium]|jgi:spermidine/putrescine transport system substrate-binding protein|nr:ABC transporter substrate-binding protein [Clostridiales bacterium]